MAEIGGVGLDPYAVGALGEIGPIQLLPHGGLLDDYERWSDGRDPHDPYTTVAYLDVMIASGHGSNWTSILREWC